MNRDATCQVIDLAEKGSLSWESIARECLQYMSEDDVKDMAESNDWIDDDDEIWEDDEDDDYDEDEHECCICHEHFPVMATTQILQLMAYAVTNAMHKL